MALFPDEIYNPRETENLAGIVYDPTNKKNLYSEDFQGLGSEIHAIEVALGVNFFNFQQYFSAFLNGLYFLPNHSLAYIELIAGCPICDLQATQLVNISGNLLVSDSDILNNLYFPMLSIIEGVCVITNNPLLTNIDLSALTNISSNFQVYSNVSLVSFNLFSLQNSYAGIYIYDNSLLTQLSFSALVYCPVVLQVKNNPVLVAIDILSNLNCINIDFSGNALVQDYVDLILQNISLAGFSNGFLDLSGGSNSVPSSAGLVFKNTLESNGWSVYVNS